jgi:hypothetical protein
MEIIDKNIKIILLEGGKQEPVPQKAKLSLVGGTSVDNAKPDRRGLMLLKNYEDVVKHKAKVEEAMASDYLNRNLNDDRSFFSRLFDLE